MSRLASIVLTLLLIPACATMQQSRALLEHKPDSLSLTKELSHTPFYPQSEYQCGPAALATVLNSYGVKVTPDELQKLVYLPERKGSLQIELVSTARRYGLLPYPLKPSLEALLIEVDAGHPVLVMQNLGFNWLPQWHYAVVVGYDFTQQEIILRSGTTKRWRTPFSVFERTWGRADFWALVIVPVTELPRTAVLSTYLKTAHAFEETGMTASALQIYRSATRRWPGEASAWITLGNMAYQVNKLNEAVEAFTKASRLAPGSAMTWNNLAYALHKLGCSEQAKRSLQCAQRLSPDDKNIRDSEQELSKTNVKKQGLRCPDINCIP